MDENQLFQKWRESLGTTGEVEARDALVKALRRYAMKICWKTLKRVEPDVVNKACFQAIEFSHKFRGDGKFTTWFYPVVVNLCMTELRKKKRRGEVSFDELSSGQVKQLPSTSINENVMAMREVVEKLPEHEQELFDMKKHGTPDPDIAEHFNVSESAVRVRWMRLKRKIKRELQPQGGS